MHVTHSWTISVMNEIIRLLRAYDKEHGTSYGEQLAKDWSSQLTYEAEIKAFATDYYEGWIQQMKARTAFMEEVKNFYYDIHPDANYFIDEKLSQSNLEEIFAKSRQAESQKISEERNRSMEETRKYREMLQERFKEKPHEKLYTQLTAIFNQYQLGLKSLADAEQEMLELEQTIDSTDPLQVNAIENYLVKVRYVRDQETGNLQRNIYNLAQYQRMGMLSYQDFIEQLTKAEGEIQNLIDQYPELKGELSDLFSQIDMLKFTAGEREEKKDLQRDFRALESRSVLTEGELERELAKVKLFYERKKLFARTEIRDETEKASLLKELDEKMLIDMEKVRRKHSMEFNLIGGAAEGAMKGVWRNILIGQRKAADEWDAVWLSMKESALNRIYEILESQLWEYLFNMFASLGIGSPVAGDVVSEAISFDSSGLAGVVRNPSDVLTDRVIERLDKLENAIVTKEWRIRGEDIRTSYNAVTERRKRNEL